jgi:hypothetical protein
MIKQTWNIDSEEKSRILNLHESATKNLYIIKEQLTPNVPFTIDFETAFPSGQYNFTPKYMNVVNDSVTKISDYIKGKNLKDFKLVITPGESQVPNPKGFEQKGSLAMKRAEVLKKYLETSLPPILNMSPQIEISAPVIGTTKWDDRLGKDNDVYKKEQFVKVSVVLNTKSIPPPPPPVETQYKVTAKDSEEIYFKTQYSNYLGAFAQVPSRLSTNIRDAGALDTGRQDVTLKIVKKDTVPFQVTDVYLVPFSWWNNRIAAETNALYPQDLEYIKKNFKRLPNVT